MKANSGKNLLLLSQFMVEIKSEWVVFALIPRSIAMKEKEEEND